MNVDEHDVARQIMNNILPSHDGCWEWVGGTSSAGYGLIKVNGKTRYTHRLMHMIHNQFPTQEKPNVCHTCDNPQCCNPDHLWSGDDADNIQDASQKGRLATELPELQGEKHHQSKLTESDVVEIRERYAAETISQSELADEYGVTQGQVGGIVRGEKWKAAGGPRVNDSTGRNGSDTGNKGGNRRLDAETVKEIRTEYANTDKSQYDLADEYGVTRPAIGKIVRGDSWPDVGGPTT